MGTPPKTVDVTIRSRQSSRINVNILTSAMLFPPFSQPKSANNPAQGRTTFIKTKIKFRCRIISTIWPTVRSLCQHFVFTGFVVFGGTAHDRHVQKRSHDFSHNDKRMFEWTRDVQQRATATYRHVLTGPTSGPDWPLWRAGNVLPPRPLLLLLLHTVYFSVFSQVPPPPSSTLSGGSGGSGRSLFFLRDMRPPAGRRSGCQMFLFALFLNLWRAGKNG